MHITNRTPLLITAWLSIFVLFESVLVFGANASGNGIFHIVIANYLQSLEYSITEQNDDLILIDAKPRIEGEHDNLEEVIDNLQKKERSIQDAAKLLSGKFGASVKWANYSPNKQFVLVGFGDPSKANAISVDLVKVSDFSVISHINLEEEVLDSQWSENSNSLAILESTVRMRKSPWGFFAALSGHPIQLKTMYVRIYDLALNREKKVKVATDIENPVATLSWTGWANL
jgi:hypothetical protein